MRLGLFSKVAGLQKSRKILEGGARQIGQVVRQEIMLASDFIQCKISYSGVYLKDFQEKDR